MSKTEKDKFASEATDAKVKEEVCLDSRIDAPRIFSEKEILVEIQATLGSKPESAKEDATEMGLLARFRRFLKGVFGNESPKPENELPSSLRISKVIKDKNGNIVSLDAVAPNAGGMGKDIKIFYLLQGKHGRNQSSATTVMHTGHDVSGKRISGEVMSEFKGGKWVQLPR